MQPTLKVSEIFQSVQGEGASSGEAATFLRLANCNLHCSYCDTKYTWDWNNYSYQREVTTSSLDAVVATLEATEPRRLVVTGGEPLLQQGALSELFALLGASWLVEVETNGTLEPSPELARRVEQWNVSPKLSASGNREGLRLRPRVLERFRATERAWLKLVVASDADLAEADALVSGLNWPKSRVLLMPEAQTRDVLRERTPFVARASAKRGYGFSGRLHLELFDGRRGT